MRGAGLPSGMVRKRLVTAVCTLCRPQTDRRFLTPGLPPLQYITTHCHVYDKEKNYVPFDFEKEEPLFAFQRKVLPDSM